MSQFAIRAEGVSKRYRVGARREGYQLLRDRLSALAAAPFRRRRAVGVGSPDHFWALDQVSFEIAPGEVVGVIGANGAGKSTLLKVLSRITEPTAGRIDIAGRIGSLLEVGTGFHQELTGRENIFLNGAILGMPRTDILRKFDEIVEFAGVERFIDQPVKHYSSGMYLRLAFSVAAHLEPDILLVDEVLAVGDMAFQRKCLGKMDEVANQGRTVVFVSHNMSVIQQLCRSAFLLDRGRLVLRGSPADCIARYLYSRSTEFAAPPVRSGESLAIGSIAIRGRAHDHVVNGEPIAVTVQLWANKLADARMFFILQDFAGQNIVHARASSTEIFGQRLDGHLQLVLNLPPLWLAPGVYSAYCKFMCAETGGASGRHESERVLLEVRAGDGQCSTGKAITVLAPRVDWNLSRQQ